MVKLTYTKSKASHNIFIAIATIVLLAFVALAILWLESIFGWDMLFRSIGLTRPVFTIFGLAAFSFIVIPAVLLLKKVNTRFLMRSVFLKKLDKENFLLIISSKKDKEEISFNKRQITKK